MFVSIKKIIPDKVKKLGIKKQVKIVSDCSLIEKILNEKIKSNFKIKVLSFKNGKLIVKTGNFHIANELKLIERDLKEEFKKNNIYVTDIRYI